MEEYEFTEEIPNTIELVIEPAESASIIPRPKTVRQLLNRLSFKQGSVLVIRDGQLLTPDRHIHPGDSIRVRVVASSG